MRKSLKASTACNKKITLVKGLLVLASLMLTTSCSMADGDYTEEPNQISFLVNSDDEWTTRGSQVSSVTSFGVSASVYDANSAYTTAQCGNYFYCINATSGTATNYYWPTGNKKTAFYAYYPYGNANLTVSAANTVGRPIYTYTVPQTIASQVDVMTAEVIDRLTSNTSTVALTFGHRLSGMRFLVHNQQSATITVKGISVYGVKYAGTYTTGSTWTLTGSINSSLSYPFRLTANTNVVADATIDITSTDNQFFMLPQTVASGTDFLYIETQETVAGDTYNRNYTYTLPEAFTLEMGKIHIFTLTLGNGQLSVSNSTSVMNWEPIVEMTNGGVNITNWQAEE